MRVIQEFIIEIAHKHYASKFTLSIDKCGSVGSDSLDNFLLPNGTEDWGKFLGNLTAYYVKIILQIEADNNTTPP